MQNLTVACLQIDQAWEDRQANYLLYNRCLHKIAHCDLVVFPEMFDTGFTMNTALAEDFSYSQGLCYLKEVASQKKTAIYTSLMTKEKSAFFNRGVFVQASSDYSCYDKRKLFGMGGEDQVFSAGKAQEIVELNGWKINLQICYDLRFPEISRNKMNNGEAAYDVCIYVANWPQKRIKHWDALLRSRAIENQSYVIGVNRIGKDGNQLEYSGGSVCYDPQGDLVWSAGNGKEEIGVFDLKYENLNLIRSNMPFLKDAY